VGRCDVHVGGTAIDEQVRGGHDGSRGVDHVVDDHARAPVDLADHLRCDGDVVRALRATLVDERDVAAEAVGVPPGELAATCVRCDEDGLTREGVPQVLLEHRYRGQVIDGIVEETLDLSRVQVDRHHAVRAGDGDEIGDEPRADRFAAFRLSVLARIPVERCDRRDALRRRALRRVDHDQLFHQAVVGGLAMGLEHEHVRAPDALAVPAVDLAVREGREHHLAERHPQMFGDLGRELLVATTGHQHQPLLRDEFHDYGSLRSAPSWPPALGAAFRSTILTCLHPRRRSHPRARAGRRVREHRGRADRPRRRG
jgi:hypothetical protein